jgi:hypothetical protein
MTTDSHNDLAAALRARLSDLATVAKRLEAYAETAAPPLILARLLVSVDKYASGLRKYAEALGAATQPQGGAR